MPVGSLPEGQRPRQSGEGNVEGECHLLFVLTAQETPAEEPALE